jgi:membrane protein DedA with SNARE-associated domain
VGGPEITHLLHEYGCAMVFVVVALQAVGVPLPGTTALAAAALYAATDHGLPIVGVIAAGAGGALTGSAAGFALGRWRGEELLLLVGRRLRQSAARVETLRAEVAAHGGIWLIVARHVTGLRNVGGIVAGASGMSVRRFVLFGPLAALIWALVSGLEYYWFGRAITSASTWLQILLVVVGVAWLAGSFVLLRRRALARLERAAPPQG